MKSKMALILILIIGILIWAVPAYADTVVTQTGNCYWTWDNGDLHDGRGPQQAFSGVRAIQDAMDTVTGINQPLSANYASTLMEAINSTPASKALAKLSADCKAGVSIEVIEADSAAYREAFEKQIGFKR